VQGYSIVMHLTWAQISEGFSTWDQGETSNSLYVSSTGVIYSVGLLP
jgi:hypothetical protein